MAQRGSTQSGVWCHMRTNVSTNIKRILNAELYANSNYQVSKYG